MSTSTIATLLLPDHLGGDVRCGPATTKKLASVVQDHLVLLVGTRNGVPHTAVRPFDLTGDTLTVGTL